MIHILKSQGHSIRSIARNTGLDRRTIARRLGEPKLKPYAKRFYPGKLDMYKPYIDQKLSQALPKRIPSTAVLEEIVIRFIGV